MSGFTDYHAHFVYGVDDGAQTREEMYAMLDAAAADGVRHLFATSHSTPGMERFPQEVYDRHLALARAYCTQKGYDLKLEHGSELLYTPAAGYAAGLRAAVQPYGRNYGTKIDRNGRHGISCITAFAVSNKNRLGHLFRSVVLRTNCTEEVLFRNYDKVSVFLCKNH